MTERGREAASSVRRLCIDDSLLNVRTGDVLKWPSGVMRVVRLVHQHGDRRENPRKTFCFFVIKHCSWTRRCYTLYNIGELAGIGVRNTRVNIKFKTRIDERIVEEMERAGRPQISCCKVRGLP